MTGCATGGTAKPVRSLAPGSAAPLTGTVTVWSWDVAAQAMKRLAPVFQQQHPGTTVQVVDIGYDSAYDKITVGLQAGTGLPDLLTVEGSRLPSYLGSFPAGFFDLTALAGRYRAQYAPAAWGTVTDPQGRVRGLPWDIGPCGLFYRSDLFRQAGIDPAAIATWDDYVKAGVRLKAATGQKLLVLDSVQDSTLGMLLQQQGQSLFAGGGKVAVDTPQAVRALTLLKTLSDQGLVDYEKGWDGLVTATKTGRAATAPTAAWWSGTLTGEMPELKGKFDVLPLPAFEPGGVRTSNQGGSTLAVTAQSKNPQLAWAFAEFMLAEVANQVSMLKNEGLFPAYLPALADPFVDAPQEYYGGRPAFRVFADLAKSIPPVEQTKDGAKAGDIMDSTVSGVLLRGQDPAKALASAAQQIATATGRTVLGA
ncbi:sugar ABC transporter substrate-binding protein [Kitasatospora sp. MMS16-BH015]|uniref:ABC transporter substrate-binding protein n=1 Tax=Kitasatospora sp. MMS16-BH015 TaxID=2018025 RepID=UPI001C2BF391|nr:sugar ABC transporter substrate-binding protein [Kitasatospora sp. MMS16-BH015]